LDRGSGAMTEDELAKITRRCNICGQEKPLTQFSKNKKGKYGRQYTCKECSREYQRQRREERKAKGVVVPQEKKCSLCGEVKPASEFYADITAANGLSSQCKECILRVLREKLGRPRFFLPEGHKRCKQCGEVKPFSEFRPNTGRNAKCFACLEENRKRREAEVAKRRSEMRRRIRARSREYHKKHREELAARSRDYYRANRDYLKARAVDYYWQNRESVLAQKREWARKNREIVRAKQRQRAILENGLPGTYSEQQWKKLCEMFDGRCARCGKRKRLTVDHMIPITWEGSTNWITNIQPLCLSCNAAKGNRNDIDYRPPHIREWAESELRNESAS